MEEVMYTYKSGENEVTLQEQNGKYTVITNGSPVLSTSVFPDALNKYYRDISTISDAQQSGHDMAMTLFGNEVVKINRVIIPRLAQLGHLKESRYVKMLTKQLEDVMKFVPPREAGAWIPSPNDGDMNQGTNEINLHPSRESGYKVKKVKLRQADTGMQPYNEFNDLPHSEVERPTKISNTYQQKVKTREQRPIEGDYFEPAYLSKEYQYNTDWTPEEEAFAKKYYEEESGEGSWDKLDDWTKGIEIARPTHENMTKDDVIGTLRDKYVKPVSKDKVLNTIPYKNLPPPILNMRKSRVARDDAFDLGEKVGVDFNKVGFDDWMEGLKIEHEHKDVVHDDHLMIAKIANAHLKEDPKYYTKLKKYVEKSLRKEAEKMTEGEQAHQNMGLENKQRNGRPQPPISGGKMEKAAFSPDAPKVVTGETQEPIEIRKEGIGSFSIENADYNPEIDNNVGRPKKLVLRQQLEDGGDVEENKGEFFKNSKDFYSLKSWISSIIEEKHGRV